MCTWEPGPQVGTSKVKGGGLRALVQLGKLLEGLPDGREKERLSDVRRTDRS